MAIIHSNLVGDIAPSSRNPVVHRSLFDFGAQFGDSAAAAAATTAAWADWVLNSDEDLFLPADPDGVGFYFDSMLPPRRSITGRGAGTHESRSPGFGDPGSYLVAADGFTPQSKTFFDCRNLGWTGTVFLARRGVYAGFNVETRSQCENAMGIDATGVSGTFGGGHLFTHIGANGGTEYQLQTSNSTAGVDSHPLVGARFVNWGADAASGAGLISLVGSCDDIQFEQPRLQNVGGEMENVPIIVNSTVNVGFNRPFYRNQADFASGAGPHILQVQGGSSVVEWNGGFVEWAHLTYARLKEFFYVESGALDFKNVRFDGSSSNPPVFTDGRVGRVRASTGVAEVSVSGIRQNDITGFSHVVSIDTSDGGGSSDSDIYIEKCAPFSDPPVIAPDGSTTNGKSVAKLHGFHGNTTYNHTVEHDGANLILTDQSQVVAEVTFAAGTATVATLGVPVKVVATTAQKGAASGFTVGTDNTLTTLKPGFRRYRVWGRFSVDVASGADNLTLHVFVGGASAFETAAQAVTAGAAKLFEVDVVLEIDDAQAIELYAENEDTTANVTVAAAAERVDTTPAHGFLRVAQL